MAQVSDVAPWPFVWISKFFDLSVTEETGLVEMRIWCIKIGNV
jgi:hypothetical protein